MCYSLDSVFTADKADNSLSYNSPYLLIWPLSLKKKKNNTEWWSSLQIFCFSVLSLHIWLFASHLSWWPRLSLISQSHHKSCTLFKYPGRMFAFSQQHDTWVTFFLAFSFGFQFLFHLNKFFPSFSTFAISHCCLHTKHFFLAPCPFLSSWAISGCQEPCKFSACPSVYMESVPTWCYQKV